MENHHCNQRRWRNIRSWCIINQTINQWIIRKYLGSSFLVRKIYHCINNRFSFPRCFHRRLIYRVSKMTPYTIMMNKTINSLWHDILQTNLYTFVHHHHHTQHHPEKQKPKAILWLCLSFVSITMVYKQNHLSI